MRSRLLPWCAQYRSQGEFSLASAYFICRCGMLIAAHFATDLSRFVPCPYSAMAIPPSLVVSASTDPRSLQIQHLTIPPPFDLFTFQSFRNYGCPSKPLSRTRRSPHPMAARKARKVCAVRLLTNPKSNRWSSLSDAANRHSNFVDPVWVLTGVNLRLERWRGLARGTGWSRVNRGCRFLRMWAERRGRGRRLEPKM